MEAYPENMEANAEEMKPTAVHEQVHKEETAVETSGALKKRHRDRHIAISRRSQLKKRTQGNVGSL
jgi:hypothetical protein